MKLKTKTVYIYYDFPVVFSAVDDADNIYICLFADEEDSQLKYFCRHISDSVLMDMESNKTDIRTIFDSPGTKYSFCLNAQSEESFEAVESTEDITSFLPENEFFIGIRENSKPQTLTMSIPSGFSDIHNSSFPYEELALPGAGLKYEIAIKRPV